MCPLCKDVPRWVADENRRKSKALAAYRAGYEQAKVKAAGHTAAKPQLHEEAPEGGEGTVACKGRRGIRSNLRA